MDVRRLLTTVGTGMLAAAVTVAGTPAVATAAPVAPRGLTVVRVADDVRKIRMSWKPVTDADHYVVDIAAGDVQSVINVPSSVTSYTIDAPDACTSFKMRVGTADPGGATTHTGYTTVKSLTPSTVMGMTTERQEEGTVAAATWRPPSWSGFTPLTGYRVVFTRMSDGAVLSDTVGPETAFRFAGVDPARAYTLSVTSVNGHGECWTAKSLVDRFRPAEPSGLVVQRRAEAPGTVEVVWRAPAYGPPPTHYQLGYGQSRVTTSLRVDAATTSHTLPLDTTRSWVIELKAYNVNGGSNAVSGFVPVLESVPPLPVPAPTPTPSSDASTPAPSGTTTTIPGAEAEFSTAATTTTTTVDSGPDRTPPTITTTLSSSPYNGWFRNPVTIHFSCADTSGRLAGCPADIRVGTDGMMQRFSGTAVDAAGNTATITLPVTVDQIPPAVSATLRGAKNAAGWYATPPTVQYTCADTVSGVSTLKTCPATTPVTVDGVEQRVTGTALDKAGNTAAATVAVSLDQVAPTITATVIGEANADGWYTTAPTVRFACSDAVSGIAECPADHTVTTDGSGRPVSGTAVDRAGNTATATVAVKLDRTVPVITAEVLGEAHPAGWHRTAPTVRFACSDGGSGITGCPEDIVVGSDGAAQSVTGTAVDAAGNTATTSVTVSVDQVAPQLSATVDGTKNAAGWYRSTPTVQYTCTDEGSAVAVCPPATPVTGEGAEIQVPGTVADRAGNTSTSTVSVDIDRTAPSIAVVGVTHGAVYGAEATPSLSCDTTDQGSGVATEATVTHTRTFSGVHTVVCAGGTDRAGNTASPVTVSYTVRPTVVWLSALTHRYLAGENAATLKELDAALAKRQFTHYAARIMALTHGRKPALTYSEAVTLIYWTLMI